MQTLEEKNTAILKYWRTIRSAIKLIYNNKKDLNLKLIDVTRDKQWGTLFLDFWIPADYRTVTYDPDFMGNSSFYETGSAFFPAHIVTVQVLVGKAGVFVYSGPLKFINSKGYIHSFLPNHYDSGGICLPDDPNASLSKAQSIFDEILIRINRIWDSVFNDDACPDIPWDLAEWFNKVLPDDVYPCVGNIELLEAICKTGRLDWNSAPNYSKEPLPNLKWITLAQATKDIPK